MKKFAFLLLSLIIVFSFCKKDSTDNGDEEEVSWVKIYVKEAGTGDVLQGYIVEVSALVKHILSWSGEDNPDAERMFTETETETLVTNQYGYIEITYREKIIPDYNAFFVTRITVKDRHNTIVYDEEMEISVANGEKREFIIEI